MFLGTDNNLFNKWEIALKNKEAILTLLKNGMNSPKTVIGLRAFQHVYQRGNNDGNANYIIVQGDKMKNRIVMSSKRISPNWMNGLQTVNKCQMLMCVHMHRI